MGLMFILFSCPPPLAQAFWHIADIPTCSTKCPLLRGKADMDSGGLLRGCMPDGSPVDPNHPWYKG